jgi:hypothetical protein
MKCADCARVAYRRIIEAIDKTAGRERRMDRRGVWWAREKWKGRPVCDKLLYESGVSLGIG